MTYTWGRAARRQAQLPRPQRDQDGHIVAVAPGTARQFWLVRETDVSGISGTGVVAEGVRFSDGSVVVRWVVGDHHSTVLWESVEAVLAIHGHNGATRLIWA